MKKGAQMPNKEFMTGSLEFNQGQRHKKWSYNQKEKKRGERGGQILPDNLS